MSRCFVRHKYAHRDDSSIPCGINPLVAPRLISTVCDFTHLSGSLGKEEKAEG